MAARARDGGGGEREEVRGREDKGVCKINKINIDNLLR